MFCERKLTEEIEKHKKNLQKFQSEISNIFKNPKKQLFDPKIHSFDPRTPKFDSHAFGIFEKC